MKLTDLTSLNQEGIEAEHLPLLSRRYCNVTATLHLHLLHHLSGRMQHHASIAAINDDGARRSSYAQ